MEHGEIVDFNVTAKCPNCVEDTYVHQEELKYGIVVCQHCDKSFKIILE